MQMTWLRQLLGRRLGKKRTLQSFWQSCGLRSCILTAIPLLAYPCRPANPVALHHTGGPQQTFLCSEGPVGAWIQNCCWLMWKPAWSMPALYFVYAGA